MHASFNFVNALQIAKFANQKTLVINSRYTVISKCANFDDLHFRRIRCGRNSTNYGLTTKNLKPLQ